MPLIFLHLRCTVNVNNLHPALLTGCIFLTFCCRAGVVTWIFSFQLILILILSTFLSLHIHPPTHSTQPLPLTPHPHLSTPLYTRMHKAHKAHTRLHEVGGAGEVGDLAYE